MSTITNTGTEAPADERNRTVEAWIEGFGVNDWAFRIVQLADIDKKASHANQARIKPVDDMTVNRYGLAAAAGAKFPPLVLAVVSKKLVTVDGNHRVAGLPLGGVHEHPAYIIDQPDAVVQLMTSTANTMNGLPFTEDEVRRLAIQLHHQGLEHSNIALLSGLSLDQVRLVVEANTARDRASDQRAARKLNDSTMRTIGRLVSDDALNLMVATQAGAHKLGHNQLDALVGKANKQRSDAARIRVIEDGIAEAKGKQSRVSREQKDAEKLGRSMTAILNCNPTAVALSAADRQGLIDRIDEVVARLADISLALS